MRTRAWVDASACYLQDPDYLHWVRDSIHSRPVAVSLCVVRNLDGIDHIEGRTKNSFIGPPFYLRTVNGQHICRPTQLHEYAEKLLAEVHSS